MMEATGRHGTRGSAPTAARPPVVLMGDLTLIRPLAMANIPVVLVTDKADDIALRSRHVREHLVVDGYLGAACAATLEKLLALGERTASAYGRKVPLFCGDDTQLAFIYTHRAALARSYELLLNDDELAWALYDKGAFYQLCECVGIRAPRTLGPDEKLDRLREPLLVKPKRKTALAGLRASLFGPTGKARVFATRDALRADPAWAAHRHELIVQEYVGGDVGSLCSFHGFADERHRLLAWFCGQKLRTYPEFAGESSYIEMTTDAALERAGREVVTKLGLKGPFKIDFVRDPATGELWTLEVNARFNLWDHLGAVNGVNLLAVAYDYLVDRREPPAPPASRSTHRWLSLYRDAHAYREQHGHGLGLARWLRSIASPRTVYEVFAWEDPAPFVHWVRKYIQPKLGRLGRVDQPVALGQLGQLGS